MFLIIFNISDLFKLYHFLKQKPISGFTVIKKNGGKYDSIRTKWQKAEAK